MRIYFRYLFIRLLVPFSVGLFACTVLWIMVDLYGNIDDFLVHKINLRLILYFYVLKIPGMLVLALPAALLFSTLWTLLSLNRRSELVAFQSGGMAPIWIFSPFFLFAVIWMIVLAFDLHGPAATSLVTCERILEQVKGQDAQRNVFKNLPYVDNINHRVWMFQSLDTNQNSGKNVSIIMRTAQGRDIEQYCAREAQWNGEFWKLTGVLEIVYAANGSMQNQKTYEELDLPDVTTSPKQLSLIVSQPEQLTVPQLSQYIATSTSSKENLARYRTEWWYRALHPFSVIVLMLFALQQGMRTDRRSAIAGVVWAIIVLVAYIFTMNVFLVMGHGNRLPPLIAAIATPVIFGVIGLHLLASSNGWWWQLHDFWKQWRAQVAVDGAADLGK